MLGRFCRFAPMLAALGTGCGPECRVDLDCAASLACYAGRCEAAHVMPDAATDADGGDGATEGGPLDTDRDRVPDDRDPCPTVPNRVLYEDHFDTFDPGAWLQSAPASWVGFDGRVFQLDVSFWSWLSSSAVWAGDLVMQADVGPIENAMPPGGYSGLGAAAPSSGAVAVCAVRPEDGALLLGTSSLGAGSVPSVTAVDTIVGYDPRRPLTLRLQITSATGDVQCSVPGTAFGGLLQALLPTGVDLSVLLHTYTQSSGFDDIWVLDLPSGC